MADTTITLYGAAGCTAVTPLFNFSAGTVKVYIEDVYIKDLTSNVVDNIALTVGQKLQYTCSNWNSVTKIDIHSDKVSGDISGWTLPSSLVGFFVSGTSVSGDISGWTLPSSLVNFYVNNTSVSYNRAVGVFAGITNNLNKIDFDNCSLIQTQVDNILANCVASGIDNSVRAKTLDVGDSNAAPSGIGFMNKKILESRGWTVKITAATFYTNPNGIQMSRTGQHFSSFQEI